MALAKTTPAYFYRAIVTQLIITVVFCFTISTCIAQADYVPDSVLVPKSLLKHTSFTYFNLADSCTKAGDTIDASRYFLQISPYYFLWYGTKPGTIDTLFSQFALTLQAKDSFLRMFTDTFSSPHSATYKKLEAMFEEDRSIRIRLMNCGDSFTCAKLETRMMASDSQHFEFLHHYVVKNGWPSLRDGSLFAQLIALHNHQQHRFYASILKEAVRRGDVSPEIYNMVLNYIFEPKGGFASLFEVPSKVVIDISKALNFEMPDSTALKKIAAEAKKHCPIKWIVFVYGSKDPKKDAEKWFNENSYRFLKEDRMDIMQEIKLWVHKDCACTKEGYMWQEDRHRQKKKMSLWLVY
jgi:hypothetical protein